MRPCFEALTLFVILVPALVLATFVGLAVLLEVRDPRKVFFVQARVGFRGRHFRLVKFRTMRDTRTSHFESWGEDEQARVTRLGRVLRSTHLDELPQLLNLIVGDMNLIGPRPEMVEIEEWAERNVLGFHRRLAIKPGITGPAQITQGYTGQDVAAYARKLHINLQYIRGISLWTDLAILCRTAIWMVRGKGWAWKSQAQRASEIPEPVVFEEPEDRRGKRAG